MIMYLNVLPVKNVSRFNTLHYPNHFSMHAVHLLHVDDPPLLLLDSRFIKAFMVVLVMTPISMLRNISKLEKVHVHINLSSVNFVTLHDLLLRT